MAREARKLSSCSRGIFGFIDAEHFDVLSSRLRVAESARWLRGYKCRHNYVLRDEAYSDDDDGDNDDGEFARDTYMCRVNVRFKADISARIILQHPDGTLSTRCRLTGFYVYQADTAAFVCVKLAYRINFVEILK